MIETGISDHYMIFCTRKHNRHSTGQHKTIKMRSLRNYSKETYTNILRRKNFEWITTTTDVNDALTIFKTLITEAMDETAPEKEIRIKNRKMHG